METPTVTCGSPVRPWGGGAAVRGGGAYRRRRSWGRGEGEHSLSSCVGAKTTGWAGQGMQPAGGGGSRNDTHLETYVRMRRCAQQRQQARPRPLPTTAHVARDLGRRHLQARHRRQDCRHAQRRAGGDGSGQGRQGRRVAQAAMQPRGGYASSCVQFTPRWVRAAARREVAMIGRLQWLVGPREANGLSAWPQAVHRQEGLASGLASCPSLARPDPARPTRHSRRENAITKKAADGSDRHAPQRQLAAVPGADQPAPPARFPRPGRAGVVGGWWWLVVVGGGGDGRPGRDECTWGAHLHHMQSVHRCTQRKGVGACA